MRQTFIIYRSYAEALDGLSDEEAGKLYKAIAKYALDGVETPLEGYIGGYFMLIKPQLDANKIKYENGLKGGRPKQNQTETETKPKQNQEKPNENQTETEEKSNEKRTEANQNAMINDKCIMINDKYIKEKKARFTPPTLEELKAFIVTNNLKLDAERFLDYYESIGWKVGKNPMKDWKATARNWSRKNQEDETTVGGKTAGADQLDEIEKIYLRKGGTV